MTLNITVPVYNEGRLLAANIARLHAFATASLPFTWTIVLADNGSTDDTLRIARRLADELPHIAVLHLEARGRGRALKAAWTRVPADILSYMDADLSSDFGAFPLLLRSLSSDNRGARRCDVATGSRLLDPTLTTRSLKRELISRAYNLLLKTLLGTRFCDA